MFLDSLDKEYEAIELQDKSEDLDVESKLIFLIMRSAAFELFEECRTFEQFKRFYKKELKATGQVFEWLGLAKSDKAAPLGWRSTIRLQYALVQRGYIHRETRIGPSVEDDKVFEAIYQGALGRRVSERTDTFVSRVLAGFGLARTFAAEYYRPTLPLKNLLQKAKARHSPKAP